MRDVMTVTGPRRAEDLGAVLPFEHLIADHTVPDDLETTWRRVGRRRPVAATDRAFYEAPVDIALLSEINLERQNRDDERLDDVPVIAQELRRMRAFGGRTVVDVTAADAGRDPRALHRLALLTGVDVVMSAGWRSARWMPELASRSVDDLTGELLGDLEHGRDGVRAGVIALTEPLVPGSSDDALLRAAARAAARADAPLVVAHPDEPADAFTMLDLLAAEGAAPGQVAITGLSRFARDPDHLDRLAAPGVWLGFDRLGRIPTVYTEVSDHQVALALLRLGEGDARRRLLVSNGTRRKIDLTAFGGTGYAFLFEQFLPYLRGLGADPDFGSALTHDNPVRFLSRQEA